MTAAQDAARLQSIAGWLQAIDGSGAAVLATTAQALNSAAPALEAAYEAANPGTLTAATPTITSAASAASALYNALYSGAGYGPAGSSDPLALQNDAAQILAIATRVLSGTATAADADWLASEATFFESLGDAATTFENAAANLTNLDLSSVAPAGSAPALDAFTNAVTAITNAIFPTASDTNPNAAALSLQSAIVPDIRAALPTTTATSIPSFPGGPPATQPTAPPKTSAPASSSSSGMVVIGVAAAAGIGLLGYELWKRAAARAVRAAR